MNDKRVAFILGLAVGFCSSWLILKNKYAKEEYEEDSCEDTDVKDEPETTAKSEETEEKRDETISAVRFNADKGDIKEFVEKLKNEDFKEVARDYTNTYLKEPLEYPYAIAPDEFGEFSDYETIELILFSNGVITDDEGEPVDDDITDMIGEDFASHFGEYEDDAVYIRNDERMADYEIIRDEREYVPKKEEEW